MTLVHHKYALSFVSRGGWVIFLKMSRIVPREYTIVLEMPTPNKMMANDVTCFKNLKLNSHNVSDRVPDTFLTQKSKHCKRKKADIYPMKF